MVNKIKLPILFSCIFLSLLALPAVVWAEKVKPLNPDCEVCPTVIAYDPDETKDILGLNGLRLLIQLKNRKTDQKISKIDLDGKKSTGSEQDPDEGYELLVYSYKHLVAINAIQDTSSIKINTDYKNLKLEEDSSTWRPEIQLMPSNTDAIDKTDDLESAWKKMKGSRLYQLINQKSADHKKWKDNLIHAIQEVLDTVSDD